MRNLSLPMTITFTLPDDVAWLLAEEYGDVQHQALELLLGHACLEGVLTHREAVRLLRLPSAEAAAAFAARWKQPNDTPLQRPVHLEHRRRLLRERLARNTPLTRVQATKA